MKEEYLRFEAEYLSEFAVKSGDTKGRMKEETPCPMRTEFRRDRDRIIHSKAFRRLKHKTQVFIAPQGDHYRTRMTHTIEVMQIAGTIARCLKLNEDLTEAIAWGHDLGHTPYEVIDGIKEHRGSGKPATLEGKVIQFADRIAYLNHDIDDAVRAGILGEEELPDAAVAVLGSGKRARINNMVWDIVQLSYGKNFVGQSARFEEATAILRKFMFENVYLAEHAIREEARAKEWLTALYDYYKIHPETIPELYLRLSDSSEQAITDYMASMTDTYAIDEMKKRLGYDWYSEVK